MPWRKVQRAAARGPVHSSTACTFRLVSVARVTKPVIGAAEDQFGLYHSLQQGQSSSRSWPSFLMNQGPRLPLELFE
jgi:hypothetical protein